MSETPSISVLTSIVPGLTIIALLVMIAAAIFHVATLSPPVQKAFNRADAPTAPDYTQKSSWFLLPESETPGGWEKPWGVDLYWFVDTPDGYLGGWNVPIDWSAADTQLNEEDWITAENNNSFPVYAPRRRHAAAIDGDESDAVSARALEEEDILKSIDVYLETHHRQRGIFLGGKGSGLSAAIDVIDNRIADTRPLDQLLGGLIISPSQGSDLPTDMPPWPDCEETITEFPCLLDLRQASDIEGPYDRVQRTFEKFSTWMDLNVTKPAAPLPPFETIELSPIRRPGEIED